MALTRLGWDVITDGGSSRLVNFPWVTGKVRKGDGQVILDYFCRRFDAEVEGIVRAWSWAWAYRAVRGASVVSEHAGGWAIDLNAPKHGLGRSGTFSAAQVRAIRRILADLDGVVRWGGDYRGRKDEMHFELQGGLAKLAAVADKIRGGSVGDVKPTGKPSKPKPSKPAERVKENSGNSTEDNKAIAKLLNALGFDAGYPDGVPGPRLRAGVKAYQQAQEYFPGMKADGNWGPMTQAHFEWVRDELQPTLNEWKASKRVSELALDGSYGPLVRKCVRATQTDNYALYRKAGGYYKDGLAGPITCAFLGVKKHPSA